MPTFIAVRCIDCSQYQVKQQVKARTFSCAVCGKKQTLQRMYAVSDSAKDCRLRVQELNMGMGIAREFQQEEACACVGQLEEAHTGAVEQSLVQQGTGCAGSRWKEFECEAEQESEEEAGQLEQGLYEVPHFVTRIDTADRSRGGGRDEQRRGASKTGRGRVAAALDCAEDGGHSHVRSNRAHKRRREEQHTPDRQRGLLAAEGRRSSWPRQQQHLGPTTLHAHAPLHQLQQQRYPRMGCADATNRVLAPPPAPLLPHTAPVYNASRSRLQATLEHMDARAGQGMLSVGCSYGVQGGGGGGAQHHLRPHVQAHGITSSHRGLASHPQAGAAVRCAPVTMMNDDGEAPVTVGALRDGHAAGGAAGAGSSSSLIDAQGTSNSKWGAFLDTGGTSDGSGGDEAEPQGPGCGFVTIL